MQKLRYRSRTGVTGFEDGTFKGVGPDPELKQLFWWLMDDAWGWSHSRQRFMRFAEEKSRLAYPEEFLDDVAWNAPRVTFHAPSDRVRELFDRAQQFRRGGGRTSGPVEEPPVTRFHGLQRIQALQTLLSLLPECGMILNWQAAYGDNPVMLAADIQGALARLAEWCGAAGLAFTRVATESDLPEW